MRRAFRVMGPPVRICLPSQAKEELSESLPQRERPIKRHRSSRPTFVGPN
jgi:hypothetical protein